MLPGGQTIAEPNGAVVTDPPNVVVFTLLNGQVVTETGAVATDVQTGVNSVTAGAVRNVALFSFGTMEAFVAVLFWML